MVWPVSSANWTSIRDAKQAQRETDLKRGREKLGSKANISISEDLPYLSASVSEIVHRITVTKRWTSTRVLEAYIRSALRAQAATNCLTEVRFVEALEEAKKLDADFASNSRPKGILHGVPISLKDLINMAGRDSSIGASMHCNEPAAADASVVTILRDAGAIAGFCKTNVPQTMLSFECSNPIFGITTNPYGKNAVPGGSSGGEAALIAADGSPVGMGSDIGGSSRIPAHFSGCFGIKPCWGRLPVTGCFAPTAGFEGIKMSLGPLGRTPEDLELVLKALIQGAKPYWHADNLIPLPWRDQPLPSKLRLGYYLHDNFIETSPACVRAVKQSVKALEQAGHELIELPPPDTLQAITIFTALTSADGHERLFSHLGPDPPEPALFLLRQMPRLGSLRHILSSAVSASVDAKLAMVMSATGKKSVKETLEWQKQRDQFIQEVRQDLWQTRGLDGIIAPVQATPALPPASTWNLSPLAAQTIMYNVVDSTVGVVPVTFVDPDLDERSPEADYGDFAALPMSAVYGTRFKAGVYQPKGSMRGLPVGVQVVGPAWSEEKTLGMMKVLDRALGDRGFSCGSFARRKG